jgi:hypothetical protein
MGKRATCCFVSSLALEGGLGEGIFGSYTTIMRKQEAMVRNKLREIGHSLVKNQMKGG